MNSVRIRIDDPVFYPNILHAILDDGFYNEKIKEGGRNVRVKEIIGEIDKYVYLVTFRVFKKNSNEITYNYICYPNIYNYMLYMLSLAKKVSVSITPILGLPINKTLLLGFSIHLSLIFCFVIRTFEYLIFSKEDFSIYLTARM